MDLGHHDDLDQLVPPVGDADHARGADEVGGVAQRLLAQRQHRRVVDVPVVGQLVEHLADVAALDRVGDLGLDPHQVALGADEHAVGGDLGVERVPEPAGIELRPEPRVAVRGRQPGLEPAQVLVERLEGGGPGRLDLGAQAGSPSSASATWSATRARVPLNWPIAVST